MAKRRRGSRPAGRKPKLGTGVRHKRLTASLARRKGIRNPKALAAAIGRKKYGSKRMAQMAARGRKRAAARKRRR